jgi:hypothetical protein
MQPLSSSLCAPPGTRSRRDLAKIATYLLIAIIEKPPLRIDGSLIQTATRIHTGTLNGPITFVSGEFRDEVTTNAVHTQKLGYRCFAEFSAGGTSSFNAIGFAHQRRLSRQIKLNS